MKVSLSMAALAVLAGSVLAAPSEAVGHGAEVDASQAGAAVNLAQADTQELLHIAMQRSKYLTETQHAKRKLEAQSRDKPSEKKENLFSRIAKKGERKLKETFGGQGQLEPSQGVVEVKQRANIEERGLFPSSNDQKKEEEEKKKKMGGMMPGGPPGFGKPGMMPGMKSSMKPGMMPGGLPGFGKPGMMPGMKSSMKPGMMPGGLPGFGKPGMMPGMTSSMKPDMMPGGLFGMQPGMKPSMTASMMGGGDADMKKKQQNIGGALIGILAINEARKKQMMMTAPTMASAMTAPTMASAMTMPMVTAPLMTAPTSMATGGAMINNDRRDLEYRRAFDRSGFRTAPKPTDKAGG